MRDKIKDEKYWNERISRAENFQRLDIDDLASGRIKSDRINIVKRYLSGSFIDILSAKYSSDYAIKELKGDLINAIQLTHESWDGFWLIKTDTPTGSIILKQYSLDAYDEMLWMLSLGYLLDIAHEDFNKLVEVIDRDGVKDFLLEFIIRAKLIDRKPITEESYQEFFGIPHTFKKLRQAINETDKARAQKLVKEFIVKDWYKEHKDVAWYDIHKSKHNIYVGYWSFETAAVVKIMGLDDNSFINCPYYPKDLIHV